MTANATSSAGLRYLSTLERAIVEAVVYSDVFDYPVTAAEIRQALSVAASQDEVEAALASDNLLPRLLSSLRPYFSLRGREHVVAVRLSRQRSSQALRRQAERYAGLIARLPCVRMVALTGSLAVDNADAGDDIDYLVATDPGRVWLARAMTMAVVRLAALRGLTLCPNYVLSRSALALPDRDVYTARELVQMLPLAGGPVYYEMLAANAWWRDFLPNAEPAGLAFDAPVHGHSRLRRCLEAALRTPAGDALERWLLRRKGDELRRQAPANAEAVFDATMCKGHFEGHRARTRAAIEARLRAIEEAEA